MEKIGFSTGALALGDFRSALEFVIGKRTNAIELSALRVHELTELMNAISGLALHQFAYVSIHAPSLFAADEEDAIVAQLELLIKLNNRSFIFSLPIWSNAVYIGCFAERPDCITNPSAFKPVNPTQIYTHGSCSSAIYLVT